MANLEVSTIVKPEVQVQKFEFNSNVNRFMQPFRMMIAGPSQSGKSSFILELLKHRNELFSTSFARIIYFVPSNNIDAHQEFIQKLKTVYPDLEIQTDLPKLSDIKGDRLSKLFIMDDLMNVVFNHPMMEEVFSQNSHHQNLSIIFTTQNYFASSKNRTIIRQTNYKIIFNDPSDKTLMRNISCQISGSMPQFLSRCFKTLEEFYPKDNFSYILIDSNAVSPLKKFQVRSKILPESDGKIRPVCFFSED
jgi:adenosyl cobinamide kinase/adenosyl cobinamide phosphate guanylyltransferase